MRPIFKNRARGVIKALALALLAPTVAFAMTSAPAARKPVDAAFFTGEWFEIARTANDYQKDCQAPTYLFQATRSRTVDLTLTCRKGSPSGPAQAMHGAVRVPQDQARTEFKVSALGGLYSMDYRVLDIAADDSWSILATTGGDYVWLLSRAPAMDSALRGHILSDIQAMGYDLSKIVLPRQA